MTAIEQGYIDIWIDEIVPCLKDTVTGDIKKTLKDDNTIQGLVGIRNGKDSHAAYLHWACSAPHSNKHEFGSQKYVGVDGHLFAIAADKSIKWGYKGAIHGFTANEELLRHYMDASIRSIWECFISTSFLLTKNKQKIY